MEKCLVNKRNHFLLLDFSGSTVLPTLQKLVKLFPKVANFEMIKYQILGQFRFDSLYGEVGNTIKMPIFDMKTKRHRRPYLILLTFLLFV